MLVLGERRSRREHIFKMPLPTVTPLIRRESVGNGAVRGLLQIEVKRCVDAQTGFMHLFGAEAFLELAPDLFLEPRRHRALGPRDVQTQRRIARLFRLHVRDHAVRLHLAQNQVAPAQRALRIENRREGNRPLRQSGEQGGFSQGQIFGMLRKVEFRGSFKSIHPAAEINLVAVERKDLLLRESTLDLDSEIRLLYLAAGGPVRREKEIARQLHGQSGSALRSSMAADVVPGRAGHAKYVDAPVRLEVFVFDRDHRLAQDRREVVIAYDDAALQSERTDQATLAVIEVSSRRGAIAFEIVDLRQIRRIDQRESRQ